MTTRTQRLKEACGIEILPAHLAKACRVSRTAAGKWFKGGQIKARHLFRIADTCKVRARWLELGEGPKHAGKLKDVSDEAIELAKHYDKLPPQVQHNIADLLHTLTRPDINKAA